MVEVTVTIAMAGGVATPVRVAFAVEIVAGIDVVVAVVVGTVAVKVEVE